MKPQKALFLLLIAVFTSPSYLQPTNEFQSPSVNDVTFIKKQLLASINSIVGVDLAPLVKVVEHADPVTIGRQKI